MNENKMDLSRHIVFSAEVDTSELLDEWRWIVPQSYTPIMLTKFGDWFFKAEHNRLVFLDLLDGALFDLGNISDAELGSEEFLLSYKDQISIDWVEICMQRGLVAHADQCYGWKVHPALGGKLEFENIKVFSLRVYQSLIGQLFRQLKPDMKITEFSIKPDQQHPDNG